MRAIAIRRFGPPEVLVETDQPVPLIQAGQVRIHVHCSGINFADLLQRLGLYGNAPRTPYVPGFEVSGIVSEVDSESPLQVGDRVVALTPFGGYAEEIAVNSFMVRRVPEELSLEQAAAIPVNYLTAWFCLYELGRLSVGEKVLIQGGAGGVGIAAIQLARLREAQIYATAGSAEKVRFLQESGVQLAINYREQDFAQELRTALGSRPIDVVLDAVGGETLAKGYRLLSPLGRLVSYGLSAAAGTRRNWIRTLLAWFRTPRFDPLDLIQRNVGVSGFHLGLLQRRQTQVGEAFDQILNLCQDGLLSPVIAETFPLTAAGAAAAHRFIHERRNIGKVLLVRE